MDLKTTTNDKSRPDRKNKLESRLFSSRRLFFMSKKQTGTKMGTKMGTILYPYTISIQTHTVWWIKNGYSANFRPQQNH